MELHILITGFYFSMKSCFGEIDEKSKYTSALLGIGTRMNLVIRVTKTFLDLSY